MNRPPADYTPDTPSFTALLRHRARQHPERRTFTFLADGQGAGGDAITLGELDRRARVLGAKLQSLGLAGGRALLLYPPGLEFVSAFLGCLHGGVAAVPAYLPRLNRPMTRLRGIVANARPAAVLTVSSLLPDADRWAEGVPELLGLHQVATDALDPALAEDWRDPGSDRDTLAFLQYTSGSTAAAKGVMVSHGNLLHNSALIRACFHSHEGSRGVFWLPLYHDMGLIGGILQTIYCDGASTLLSPVAFLQRPLRWLQAISETGATISGGPNFAYDLCARKVTDAQRATLDLSRWEVAFNGAEPIRPETLDRFAEAFAPCGFRREAFLPCYGLAESTLIVSGGPRLTLPVVLPIDPAALGEGRVAPAAADARGLVGSGRIAPDHEVAIVDPDTGARCPADRVGEIWVSGPSVAQGYWDRPQESSAFGATLAGTGEGPFLRTGDLGFVRDGELFVAGRLKDLVIIRGRNVYPQDVEWTAARAHPALRPDACAAFSVDGQGDERLVLVQEVERGVKGRDAAEIVAAIRLAIAEEHDLEVADVRLLKPMGLPRTSSGKVRRHACRETYLAGDLETIGGEPSPSRESSHLGNGSTRSVDRPDATALASWIAAKVAGPLGVEPSEVDVRAPFASFGLGSLRAVELAGELEEWLGRPLAATLLYEHPTIEALARHLAGVTVVAGTPGESRGVEGEPIAIIGIGCRFPGADGPEAFWQLLRDGRDAVGEMSPDRVAGAVRGRRAGFLGRVDGFDADFFGISPREAARMDPQQRLLLEVAWEALEDAGQPPEGLAGAAVGVFIGLSTNDYGRLQGGGGDPGDAYAVSGVAASIAANRLSYAFDFRGPSLAIDTACSSSLVAVELACRSLRDGESALALAGGANLILSPEVFDNFANAGFLAPDGRCKTFDARADGYARGEGAGVVVLKPLGRALADGDPIYATILGGAFNQDGRTNGLTAPSPQAQEAVLRDAYRRAGVAPGRVQFVEAHGTGTLLGDPIEAQALGAVLAEGRAPGQPCALGSAKTNIGHLEAAAGIAGLIKAALAITHRALPPSLHFAVPNPHIPFDALALRVQRTLGDWPLADGLPVLAGVSAFGFGGTNAHVVLAGVDPAETVESPAETEAAQLLPISARSPGALQALARSYRDVIAEGLAGATLRDLSGTLGARRGHHGHRLALTASTRAEAVAQLDAFLKGEADPGTAKGRAPSRPPRLAFVFSGQGAQAWGMGRQLLADEPAFRQAVEACDRALAPLSGWSLMEELTAVEGHSRLAEPGVSQPAMFAIQVGLAALWRSWGITPDAIVGHSLGEVAAAHVAGALSLEDAAAIAFHRGRLMARVAGRGQTAALGLSESEARRLVDGSGGTLALAAVNGPESTTLSGDPDAIAAVVRTLAERDVFARVLGVACAFHGPQMDPLRPELVEALAGIVPRTPVIPLVSTVTGRFVAGPELDAPYWGRNLRETVRFAEAVGGLIGAAHHLFVEVGPHPALAGSIARGLRDHGREGTILPSLRRGKDDRATMLRSLGTLYTLGRPVDWRGRNPGGRFVRLPSYPWQRERHWIETAARVRKAPAIGNGRKSPEVADLISELRWVPKDRPTTSAPLGGPWLIVADALGVGRALGARLEEQGTSCEIVSDAVDFRHLLAGRAWRGVVYLRGLDAPETAGMTVDDLDAAQVSGCGGLLELAQAMAAVANPGAKLWVATRGAQPAGDDRGALALALAQAPLWGMGRALAVEAPGTWGGLVDLDPESTPREAADALAAELADAGGEDQLAYRRGRRYVARLVRVPNPSDPPLPLALRPGATYLITGGLGELGRRAARWLVRRGARRLVLVGRKGLPRRGTWDSLPEGVPARAAVAAIRRLERLGATVRVEAADVGDVASLGVLFDRLADELPPIRGVVHAAGLVTPHGLRELDADALRAVLRPKVAGTWNLHQRTRDLELDFFVAASSVASVLGAKEPAYAAANQFLDAFAHHARAHGRPALSVNWGPWAGGGMASAPERARAFQLLGLTPLRPARAFAALDRLLATGATQAVVAAADWFTIKVLYGQDGRGPLLERIEAAAPPPAARPSALDGWREDTPDRRRERLVGYFRGRVAGVLGLEPSKLDADRPLNTLGLDSLMAIEIKGGVEADLGTALPLTSLLEGPTIAQLADLASAQCEEPAPSGPLARTANGPDHPLSRGQQALWSLHQLDPESAAYHMVGAARIRAALEVDAPRRSLRRLVERHASLRTTVPADGGIPSQHIDDSAEPWFVVEDARGLDADAIRRRLEDEARRPFDLQRGPLLRTTVFRTAPDEHVLLLAMHHVAGDFWSIAVLLQELGLFYPAERAGTAASLPPLPLDAADFAHWQSRMLAGPEGERLWAYWREQLAGPLPTTDLPTDRPRPALPTHRGASRTIPIDADLTRRLSALAARQGASLHVALLAAFQALLARYGGGNDVIVGSPAAGRGRAGLSGVVGYFVNPLPMRARFAPGLSFSGLLGQVRRTVIGGLEHQDFPFPMMVDRLNLPRDPGRSPVFSAMFAFQKAQRLDAEGLSPFALGDAGPTMDLGGLPLESLPVDTGSAQFDLTLRAAEVETGLTAALEYAVDLFDETTAARMLGHLRTLLEGAVAAPDRPLADLPLLTIDERQRVLDEWNATAAEFPREATIHRLIEAQAARSPTAIAVACGGRSLTYGELNARANQLARHLRTRGVGPERLVGVCLPRSIDLVVGLLGVLKAGGAYVPMDPEYPAERLAFLLRNAGAAVLLTTRDLRDRLPEHGAEAKVVTLDADGDAIARESSDAFDGGATAENLAYVIHTSGSTGTPKGVMVGHRNLVASTLARVRTYGEAPPTFLMPSSFAFDSSVAGLFWTLTRGGSLVLPADADRVDPRRLAALVRDQGASHLLAVPSLIGLILEEAPAEDLQNLRTVIAAGEPCPRDLPTALQTRLPAAVLFNEYGPTEATVWCTVHRCDAGQGEAAIPIGRPIANARAYLLDPSGQPVPVGVPGELFIGGEGVARGYLGRPALTAETFVPDPFGPIPGGRIYRTGDLARRRADGVLEFLGRVDHQVKVRGFRIELGEVETALARHPAVREAAVAALDDAKGEKRLVGYVVADAPPDAAELRRWLRERLPEYMVPAAFVTLEALPVTPNGKVDRRALPEPVAAGRDAAPLAPRNPVEQTLARLTAGVLGVEVEAVGVLDNFFDLGVDSILGIQIVSRARQAGLKLDPADLFRHPSVAELAAAAGVAVAVAEENTAEALPVAAFTGLDPRVRDKLLADEREVEDAYPLSPVQEGMLFHSLAAPDSGVYVQQSTCVLRGVLDVPAFRAAWQAVVDRHPVLRTSILWVDSDLTVQAVRREATIPLEELDWRGSPAVGQSALLEAFLQADRQRGFVPSWAPLMRLALMRLDDGAHQLVWSYHHLLLDGWCLPILLREVLASYEAARAGRAVARAPARPYRDYIAWLRGQDLSEAEAYWRRELRGFRTPTPLSLGRDGAAGDHEERRLRLSTDTTAALAAMARRHQLTLNTLLQGAWALLLARYAGQSDVVFGATVSGRPPDLPGVESMIGLFINTLPVRVPVADDAPLIPWLQALQARQAEMRRFEFTPPARVRQWSDVPRGRPLFESILIFENYPMDAPWRGLAGALEIDAVRVLERTSYPLTLMVIPDAEMLLRVDHDARRFEPAAIDRLLNHLKTLLEGFVDRPNARLADVPMLSEAEQGRMLRLGSPSFPPSTDPGRPRNDGKGRAAVDLDRLSDAEVDSLIAALSPGEEADPL